MTSETLAAVAAVILSLAFSYVPGLSDKWDALNPTQKRAIMAGLLVVVAGSVFGLSCANVLVYVTCDKQGALGLVQIFIAALVANQAAFALTPRKEDVRLILG